MLFDKSAILTVQNHVITRNPRISVSHDKHRTWFLHINDVHEEDKGKYMCQINTANAKTQYGYLHVVVPPNIDDSQSSSDAIVREGANVTLTCKATGSPTPNIRWKRDDGSKISINKTLSVAEWEGETLEMARISRLDMGAYLCIASNGIPPTVSKQIKVSVDFPPMLWIPHQLVGAPLGYAVTLECYTEAHPTSLNYWAREDGLMIHESSKYKATSSPDTPSYKTHMTLMISNIQKDDYGSYKCIAKNPRGETDGTIRLYRLFHRCPMLPQTFSFSFSSLHPSLLLHSTHSRNYSVDCDRAHTNQQYGTLHNTPELITANYNNRIIEFDIFFFARNFSRLRLVNQYNNARSVSTHYLSARLSPRE